jgi:hypothetical protein
MYKTMIRLLTTATLLFLSTAPLAAGTVDFRRDVQPILSEHCYHCHATDEQTRKGGLRLDNRDGALKGGKSDGPAIIPGDADASPVIARLLSHDLDEVMPPPKEKKPVNETQIATLKTWINEGAPYAAHWAFEAPVKSETEPGRNPIDQLVATKLASIGLQPSPPASAEVLCRRIHIDLTGLPPTPQEVQGFANAARENWQAAVESLVSRLMDSKRYGERWARVWMDAARYADSNGYEKDLPREQWAWRDWVIQAFNRDMPYDQFIIEQLAGDLMPGATQDQRIATGFLRNGMLNEEGAIIPEEWRMEGMFDRLDCVGKATMGLSVQCAQCHTHKFDPITHEEYFGLFAFLNNTYEAQSWVYTPEQKKQIDQVHAKIREINERTRKERPEWQKEQAAWEEKTRSQQVKWTLLKPVEMLSKSGLNHPTRLNDDSVLILGHPSTGSDIYLIGAPPVPQPTGLRLEILTHRDQPFNGPGRSKFGTWALTELEVHVKAADAKDWTQLKLKNATADFAEPAHRIEEDWASKSDKDRDRTVGPAAFAIDGKNTTAFRGDRGPGRRNQDSVLVVQFDEPPSLAPGTQLRVTLRTNHGGDGNGRDNTMIGRCRIALTTAPDPKTPPVDYSAQSLLATPERQRGPVRKGIVFSAWRRSVPELKALNDEEEAQWKKFPEAETSVLHLAERSGPADTRKTHLLDRGAWDQPKHEVKPHVPVALPALQPEKEHAPNRLDLARWMVRRDSPLAARVAVNRVWQSVFGSGLVETSEDFGTRAPLPEHQAVLDWLAVDFMDHEWRHKHLIKMILTSATYQQSSVATPELLERDPYNRLLTRGPRYRVDAETVRDLALTVSGLLHSKVGGPSIFPPVPESVLEYNFFKPTYWDPPTGPERYRRSLYVFRKRSMPDPVLSAFDAPNGDFSCARRPRSNTPLAALTSLNETTFVEAAQALAQRLLREGGKTDSERIDFAYRLCTSRAARPEEIRAIEGMLNVELDRLRKGELKANEIAFSSLTNPSELPADATPNQIAAWTLVSRVMLNLDETLTKN